MTSPATPDWKLPEGLANWWRLDSEIFAEAIAPDRAISVSEWADAHRVLDEMSAEAGQWRTSRTPYLRDIMDALSVNDPTQEVVVVAGTQLGKTESGNNWLGYVIDVAPGPAMMVLPTSNTGKRSSRLRINRMLDSTPRLKAKVREQKSRDASNTTTLKEFPGGALVVAGANSAAELKSMPVRYLFMDELDEYPDDLDGQGPADELAEKRTTTYTARRKILKVSSPTVEGRSKIMRAYRASDQRRFHVPCPHCEAEQVLEWGQMRWETREQRELTCTSCGVIGPLAADAAGDTACTSCGATVAIDEQTAAWRDTGELTDVWYECRHCAARIDEHEKTAMLERGRWIAQAPGPGRVKGFQISSLYSPLGWFSWRDAVAKRLEADRDVTGELMKVWTNTVLAETYSERGEQPSDIEIKKRAEPYKLRTVPRGALLLTAGVDVQGDRLEVKVKGWGRGEESWLVAWERIYGDTETADPWESLDDFLKLTFVHETGAPLRITAVGVDSGYRTQRVYEWCAPRRHRHILPMKGMSRPGKAILGQPSPQDITYRGKRVPNGVKLWPVGSDTAKERIYARLKLTQAGPGCMHWPLGLPDEYYQQLTAETLVTQYHRGYAKRVWQLPAGARNEALDLEVYAYAAALYAGVTRMNWDKLEAALAATAQDLFVQAAARDNETAEEVEAAEPAVQTSAAEPARAPITRPRPRGNWVTGFRG